MLEKRMRKKVGDDWGYLDRERVGSKWRVWKLLKKEIVPMITGSQFWRPENWAACLEVLFERPRRRKLQTLPEEAKELLQLCPALLGEGNLIYA